jgi:hypothetical protein
MDLLELRLECLRLAVAADPQGLGDHVQSAKLFFEFVMHEGEQEKQSSPPDHAVIVKSGEFADEWKQRWSIGRTDMQTGLPRS